MNREIAILETYDKAYEAGNRRLKVSFFGKPLPGEKCRKLTNAEIGILCRHACEKYMHWTWKEISEGGFTKAIQSKLMLDRLIQDIEFPGYVSVAERDHYLMQLMYPEEFECGIGKDWGYVLDIFSDVVEGRKKAFPHGFFNGGISNDADRREYSHSGGYLNLCICFLYGIDCCYKSVAPDGGDWDMSNDEFRTFLKSGRIRDSFYNKVRLRQTLKYMTEEVLSIDADVEGCAPMSELKRQLRLDALQLFDELIIRNEKKIDKEFDAREKNSHSYYDACKAGLLSYQTAASHCIDKDLLDAMLDRWDDFEPQSKTHFSCDEDECLCPVDWDALMAACRKAEL